MHSQSNPEKTHYYFAVGDDGHVVSGCGHLMAHMGDLDIKDLDPLSTTCAGCIRSRHYKKAIKQMEELT